MAQRGVSQAKTAGHRGPDCAFIRGAFCIKSSPIGEQNISDGAVHGAMNFTAAFEVQWVVLYFMILAGCAYLWISGWVDFEDSGRE